MRKKQAPKRDVLADPIYNSKLVTKLINTIMYDGKTIADVAITAPRIPVVVYPAKVATLTPTGPGVMDEIAIISVSCCVVNHLYVSAM